MRIDLRHGHRIHEILSVLEGLKQLESMVCVAYARKTDRPPEERDRLLALGLGDAVAETHQLLIVALAQERVDQGLLLSACHFQRHKNLTAFIYGFVFFFISYLSSLSLELSKRPTPIATFFQNFEIPRQITNNNDVHET